MGINNGLKHHIITPDSAQGEVSRATMATTLEAIFGAVYLDSNENVDAIREIMRNVGIR